MFKEFVRIFYWLKFFFTTGYLTKSKSITEIGAGKSQRIQKVLKILSFYGNYSSVDLSCQQLSIISSSFKTNFYNQDFFKFSKKSDLLIFDHSIDDILAAMFPGNKNDYIKIMDNLKKFDYQDQQFIKKINLLLLHAKKNINPNGKIIISHYLTKYDQPRGTVKIMQEFLPQLSRIAKKIGLEVEYFSTRFLVLKKA